VGFGVVHLFFPCETPVADGSKNFDIGVERVAANFYTDLILPLAGTSVSHRYGSLLFRAPDKCLGYHRTRKRGVEGIDSLVYGVCLQCRPYESVDEGLTQVDHIGLHCSSRIGLCLYLLKIVCLLADIHRKGHYIVALIVEPGDRHRGIKSSAVRQYYLAFFFCCHHFEFLPNKFIQIFSLGTSSPKQTKNSSLFPLRKRDEYDLPAVPPSLAQRAHLVSLFSENCRTPYLIETIFLRVLLRGAGTSILPAKSAFSRWHFISVAEQSNPWPRHRICYAQQGRFVGYVVLVRQRCNAKLQPPFTSIF